MMLDTKANSGDCVCCMTNSGSPAWLLRCRRQLAAASNASNMKAFMPKPPCDPSLSLHLGSCFVLTLPALRPWWSWINLKMWWTFWYFVAILQTHHGISDPWSTVKTAAKFLWQGYILIFRAPAKLLTDWWANFESNIQRALQAYGNVEG